MMIFEHIKVGLSSVKKSRFRSFFTMLGIIIGVVSVVTIISLGEGVKRQISGQVADLGTNLVSIRPGRLVDRDSSGKITSVNLFASTGIASLTQKDVESIRNVEGVTSAVGMSTLSAVPSYNGIDYKDGVVVASSPELEKVINHKIEFGTYFSPEDVGSKTAVIGPKIAEKLYKEAVPIGKTIMIRGESFSIQGVFTTFSEVPITTGVDLNKAVFISEKMAQSLLGVPAPIYEILAKRNPDQKTTQVISDITSVVQQNHGGQDDFTVLDQAEASVASDELLRLLTKMIIGMAGITLLVGGIGIMNVMLVSVSERNREIGIRKSIGATDRQIRNQFVLESAILSVWGAIFGVVSSAILNIGLRLFTDLEPVLLWKPMVIASVIAVIVGILFGVIPAVKASRKDPIDSYRT